jgi:hypothetical protein
MTQEQLMKAVNLVKEIKDLKDETPICGLDQGEVHLALMTPKDFCDFAKSVDAEVTREFFSTIGSEYQVKLSFMYKDTKVLMLH